MSRRRSSGRRSVITDITDFTIFDPWLITDGLSSFGRPRPGNLLEMLGQDREERVETVAAMIRESSDDDVAEVMRIVQEAMGVVAAERAGAAEVATAAERSGRPRRQRGQSAEEWRAERRRREAVS